MSFVKGKFYRCVVASSSLTHGKYYECINYLPPSTLGYAHGLNGDVSVRDDKGQSSMWGEHRFDLSSECSTPPSFTKGKPTTTDVCSCGKKAEKKVFSTFEYFYCSTCKKEVGGKEEDIKGASHKQDALSGTALRITPNYSIVLPLYGTTAPTSTSQQIALPPGIVALKGERVTCESCNFALGTLSQDLGDADTRPILGSPYSQYPGVHWLNISCMCLSNRAFQQTFTSYKYHVKGRGWV